MNGKEQILKRYFPDFTKKQFENIKGIAKLEIRDLEDMKRAIDEMIHSESLGIYGTYK